jgi:prevent-host-death family protein
MAYTVHQAKTHFSRLLKEAEAGQEVIVMRGKKPVAKIVAITEPAEEKRHLAGAYRGRIHWEEGALDPMTDKELVEYGFDALLDGELVPPPAE